MAALPPLVPTEVRRLLVLRPDNLGDVVLFSGALRHLRSHFPSAEITICVKPVVRALLQACPHVDEIIDWERLHPPPLGRLRRLPGVRRVVRSWHDYTLRRDHEVDLALLPVVSPTPEMRRILRVLKAPRKFDIIGSRANEPLRRTPSTPTEGVTSLRLSDEELRRHEISLTRDFLRMLGLDVHDSDLWPEFWTAPGDAEWALDAMQPRAGRTTLALAPGVTAPKGKAYPVESYLRAFSELSTPPLDVVLLGAPADQEVCGRLAVGLVGSPAVASVKNLAGRTTIPRMIECLRLSDAVLGPDSATLHIAIALRKPTLCILGGGQPGRFQPWGSPELNLVATKPMDCFGCDWSCRYETMRCVQELDPRVVRDQLVRALGVAAAIG